MPIPTPSFSSASITAYDVLQSGAENGAVFHRARSGSIRRQAFTVVYRPGQLDTTRAQELIDQYNTSAGSAVPFSFAPWFFPSPVNVRFAEDDLDLDVASLVAYGTSIRLIQEVNQP